MQSELFLTVQQAFEEAAALVRRVLALFETQTDVKVSHDYLEAHVTKLTEIQLHNSHHRSWSTRKHWQHAQACSRFSASGFLYQWTLTAMWCMYEQASSLWNKHLLSQADRRSRSVQLCSSMRDLLKYDGEDAVDVDETHLMARDGPLTAFLSHTLQFHLCAFDQLNGFTCDKLVMDSPAGGARNHALCPVHCKAYDRRRALLAHQLQLRGLRDVVPTIMDYVTT